jgi:hypothetical protein
MKIKLQPTEGHVIDLHPHRSISSELPADDLDMEQVIEDLIRPALIAWGFHPATVDKYFPEIE